MPEALSGIGVSPGFAAGPVYRVAGVCPMPAPQPVVDVATESGRAVAAIVAVADDLDRRAASSRDATATAILSAVAMMARDPMLAAAISSHVGSGADAPHAIAAALTEFRLQFEAAGGYLAERAADLDDLRDRAVAVCVDAPMPGVPDPGQPFVLVARDLAPADTAGLDPAYVLALVTEAGGPTSHTAIVARSLGIPAIVRCPGVLDVPDGTLVTVDGAAGSVRTGVDADAVAKTVDRERRRRTLLAASSGPGRTADGYPVALLANIGSARDLAAVSVHDAEGVGLFRTELLYLDRADAPSRDEQISAYTEVFAAAAGRRIVIRTLDAGADKPLPFLRQDDEPNPALGMRGLRLARRDPDLLRTQLDAIAQAARATGADAWVMAPMVATPDEAADFVGLARHAGLATVGVMVEIPAAALRTSALADSADFFSIGTNDLSQYAFAADRQCGDLADLLDPWQPALLGLIAACASAATARGKPVGVCGEAAADPLLAPVLVGLGVTSLSMAPVAIPAVRASLAERTRAECVDLADLALNARNAAAARAAVAAATSAQVTSADAAVPAQVS